jgi:pentatricopeptide repeat protein
LREALELFRTATITTAATTGGAAADADAASTDDTATTASVTTRTPSAASYTAAMDACLLCGQPREALALYNTLLSSSSSADSTATVQPAAVAVYAEPAPLERYARPYSNSISSGSSSSGSSSRSSEDQLLGAVKMSALQAAAQTGSYKLALQLARGLHDAQGRIVARAVRLAVVCCMQRSKWAEVSNTLIYTSMC